MPTNKLNFTRAFLQITALVLCSVIARSQTSVGPVAPNTGGRVSGVPSGSQPQAQTQTQPLINTTKAPERVGNYVLGPDDQIIIHAFQAEELSNKPMQIGGDGFINLPLVGRVKAGGLSISELENSLSVRLKDFVKDPQVTVFVSEYRSQPVSVVGFVNIPGVVQLRGRKTLVEVIALAGGLKTDAGNSATITRELSIGRIPLPNATDDPKGEFSIARVNLTSVMNARNPRENILVEANDVIMIPRASLLYVVGEVQKPGGYAITERDSVTVLQAVALAGGLTSGAAPKKARILSETAGVQTRKEVPTNVRKILDGQAPDVELHAEDILFIPNNLPKSIGGKALESALNTVGILAWKF